MKSRTSTIDNSRATAKNLKTDLEELIRNAPSLSKDDLEQAKHKLMKRIASARRSSYRMANKIDEGSKRSKNYIAENPITVFGILVVLAALAFRRRPSSTLRSASWVSGPTIDYDNCWDPNVWCYAGPDNEGQQQDDHCCLPRDCGPAGHDEPRPAPSRRKRHRKIF